MFNYLTIILIFLLTCEFKHLIREYVHVVVTYIYIYIYILV